MSVALRKAAAPEFTIIALPDTQHYSESFPAIFTSQTQWIVNNKEPRNIVFVTHEGDVVEHNSNDTEWQRANTSMSLLDGVVPYGMGPGNHDLPTTLFNQYFPYTRYQGQPWYGGHYQNLNDNNYQLFSAGGMDFVIVHMIFCPPAGAVAWADSVFKAYPDRIGIMTTHALSRAGCGAFDTRLRQHAVPLGQPRRSESESAVHAERPRARRSAPHGCRQRADRVPDARRLSGSREWRGRLAADPAVRAGRQQGLRSDVLAVAEPVRDRRRQRVLAGLPDG